MDNQQLSGGENMELSFQEKIQNKYPDENLEVLEYSNTKKPCKIKCKTCGKVYTFKQGGSPLKKEKKNLCQDCGKRKKIKEHFEQSLRDKFPEEDFELINFTTTQNPVILRCLQCGEEVEYQVANSIRSKKHLCSHCFPLRFDELEETKRSFLIYIEKNPQWTLITNLQKISSSRELISCKCNKCGKINNKTFYDYMKNIKCFCNRKIEEVNNIIQEICQKEKYNCLSLNKQNTYRDRIILQHDCGYQYEVVAQSFINGYGRCPKCMKKKSKGERLVQDWLVNNNIKFIREYPLCLEGHTLRMDFFLPEYNIYIEYQGEQHYKSISFFGGEENFQKRQYYDNLKRKYCKNNLIEIPYYEIDNISSILSLKVQRPLCTQ